jgi:hypothetical protein
MRALRGTSAPTPVTFAGGLASCRIPLLPEEPNMNVFFLKKFVFVAKVAIIHRKMLKKEVVITLKKI